MMRRLVRLAQGLGALGIASAALIAAAALFHAVVVKPLQARGAQAAERAVRQVPKAQPAAPAGAADGVAAVYRHLSIGEDPTDWLAKLHAIGAATGLELKSASYRTQPTEGRIVRYEIVVPVAGSYPQIRDFLARSLAEIPRMSIDQLTLRREHRNAGTLQAELRMTLHMVKS